MSFGSLRQKLLCAFVAFAIIPVAVVSTLAYQRSSASLEGRAGDKLSALALAVIDSVDRNLFERYGDVQAFAANPKALRGREEATAIANFFTTNYGIYDLMIIVDLDGSIVAANTVDPGGKTLDTSGLVGRSVKGEEWFEECVSGKIRPGQTYYSDLSEDRLVAEILNERGLALNFSAPIYDEHGRIARVWSNRASWSRISQEIMRSKADLLKSQGVQTLEFQILTKNGVVIDDTDPNAILTTNLAQSGLEAAQRLVKGETGYTIETHATRNSDQIIGYAASKGALGFDGYGWGVLMRQDEDEALADARSLRNFSLLVTLLSVGVVAALALLIARGICRPIEQTVDALDAVTAGDYSRRLFIDSNDELGRMGESLNKTIETVQKALSDVKEAADREKHEAEELDQAVERVLRSVSAVAQGDLTAGVDTSGRGAVQKVAEALQDLIANLRATMQKLAENTQSLGSSSSEQGVTDAGSVTGNMEQMALSIREISQNTNHATGVTMEAVGTARSANDTIKRLGDSSAEIGKVINVITSIAEQTNLLALNATIEAARAGEAGKGFAVVANEVKELANQTSRATEEVRTQIEAIQTDSQQAVAAVDKVTEVINQINEIATSIASAVEEQTATTSSMDQALSKVAGDLHEVVGRFKV